MKEKQMYVSPHVEAVELTPGGTLLAGSKQGTDGIETPGGEYLDYNWS